MHHHHHRWTLHGFPKGKRPSDVFREHIITCFIDDAAGVRNRDLIGIDNITWECDYPHSDSTWPEAPEKLWASVKGVPDDDIHKITWQNATRHFHYDPFKHIPKEQCTVGALRAQAKDVDLDAARRRWRQAALGLLARLRHDRRHHEATGPGDLHALRKQERRLAWPAPFHRSAKSKTLEGSTVGAWIMLGTLFGLIVLIFGLVLRFDPEARGPSKSEGPGGV